MNYQGGNDHGLEEDSMCFMRKWLRTYRERGEQPYCQIPWRIVVLLALCGRIGVPGGNYLGGGGSRMNPRDPRLWRTLLTDIPAINGTFPPNVLQEEILNDHPEHIRAVLCSAANPLRSYADTTTYEEAFAKLDLLVVVDIAMSETAVLADYVLPCKTTFESWNGQPGQGLSKVYARKKPPVVEAEGEQKENANTMLRDPEWNKDRRACTLAINPADAEELGIVDERPVKIVTEAGEETIEAEITTDARKGQVIIPHGFGLVYEGVTYGANVNRLAKNTNRDFVGTPMHRYVPCRIESSG
ncbi:MAG: molybdopterin-dependent oxidoreductase [Proteobacteria bacterium]|nr:molybdopterin-dependent oxidoreductase [Pseudomonadota bacterium]